MEYMSFLSFPGLLWESSYTSSHTPVIPADEKPLSKSRKIPVKLHASSLAFMLIELDQDIATTGNIVISSTSNFRAEESRCVVLKLDVELLSLPSGYISNELTEQC
jgi:hypothetical protein